MRNHEQSKRRCRVKRCGMVQDRDVNAAINLNKVGRAHPEPTPVDRMALSHAHHEATSLDEAGSQRGAMITIAHSSQSS